MTYQHDLKSIANNTGLEVSYIRRILKKSPSLSNLYAKKRNKNKLFFNDNGMSVFTEIVRHKEEGKTVAEISVFIEKQVSNENKTKQVKIDEALSIKGISKPSQNEKLYERLISTMEELHKKENKLTEMEINMKLLTDGQSVEDAWRERQEHRTKLATAEEEVKKVQQELKQSSENAEKEREKAKEKLYTELKIKSLWKEHSNLGWWLSNKRKKEIISEIESLELPANK